MSVKVIITSTSVSNNSVLIIQSKAPFRQTVNEYLTNHLYSVGINKTLLSTFNFCNVYSMTRSEDISFCRKHLLVNVNIIILRVVLEIRIFRR